MKLLRQYKFKIVYTLNKDNEKTDALNRRSDYMEIKEVFNHSILKVNNDGSLLLNKHKLNVMLRILRNNTEQFPVKKGKL